MRRASPAHPLPAWRRWAAAWAFVALFGVAFAPSISRALQAVRGDGTGPLASLCTGGTQGSDGGTPAGDAACALCVLAHASPLVDAGVVAPPAAAPFGHILAGVASPAGVPADAPWRARARAPPSIA